MGTFSHVTELLALEGNSEIAQPGSSACSYSHENLHKLHVTRNITYGSGAACTPTRITTLARKVSYIGKLDRQKCQQNNLRSGETTARLESAGGSQFCPNFITHGSRIMFGKYNRGEFRKIDW